MSKNFQLASVIATGSVGVREKNLRGKVRVGGSCVMGSHWASAYTFSAKYLGSGQVLVD